MRIVWLLQLLLLLTTAVALGDTNTPIEAGARVSITTATGTVSGILQDSPAPTWIAISETGTSQLTYIHVSGAIVRQVAGGLIKPRVVPSVETLGPSFDSRRRAPLGVTPRRRPLRTDRSTGHYILGRPKVADESRFRFTPEGDTDEVSGMTILAREGFTLGHYDRVKCPAWVATRWTTEDFINSEEVSLERGPFEDDEDLPAYARSGTNLQFATTQLERGHMARDADLEAWGFDSVREGMRMSNIVPQRKSRNHVVWGKLEDEHRLIVADPSRGIDTVWIISGPIFDDDDEDGTLEESEIRRLNSGKGVPGHTYKIIAWFSDNDELNLRAYVIAQNDTDVELRTYLTSVDAIEKRTGLDFFWQLDDEVESSIEAEIHDSLW